MPASSQSVMKRAGQMARQGRQALLPNDGAAHRNKRLGLSSAVPSANPVAQPHKVAQIRQHEFIVRTRGMANTATRQHLVHGKGNKNPAQARRRSSVHQNKCEKRAAFWPVATHRIDSLRGAPPQEAPAWSECDQRVDLPRVARLHLPPAFSGKRPPRLCVQSCA